MLTFFRSQQKASANRKRKHEILRALPMLILVIWLCLLPFATLVAE